MFDREDDDTINFDNEIDISGGGEIIEPYDMPSGETATYDSINDLEKIVDNIPEPQNNNPEPIQQFNIRKKKSSNTLLLGVLLLTLLLGGGVFAMYSGYVEVPDFLSGMINNTNNKTNSEPVPSMEEGSDTMASRDVDITTAGDDEFSRLLNESGANQPNGENLPDLPSQIAKGQDQNIETNFGVGRIPTGNTGRMDPFNPVGTNGYFEVINPPTNVTPDLEAQSLMTVKITGIMYSSDSPSAIINIGGSDQLVRPGDKIENFYISKITKDKVTVKNGKNIYTASVGELVDMGSVGVRDVPNMRKKFAGPYSSGKGRIIEINAIN